MDEPTTFAYESEQSLMNNLLDQRYAYALLTRPPEASDAAADADADADADALEHSSSNSGIGIEPPLSPTSGLFPISGAPLLFHFFALPLTRILLVYLIIACCTRTVLRYEIRKL